jgi:hypothetical protein
MAQRLQSQTDPIFTIGDKVLRDDIPGEVRAIFTSRRGKTLYVVEYMTGVFRTCRASQLSRTDIERRKE